MRERLGASQLGSSFLTLSEETSNLGSACRLVVFLVVAIFGSLRSRVVSALPRLNCRPVYFKRYHFNPSFGS